MQKPQRSRDTDYRRYAKGEWCYPSIAPSTPFCSASPMYLAPQQKVLFNDACRLKLTLRVRIQKTAKPRAPGTLTLGKACKREHGTAPTCLPLSITFYLAPPVCLPPQPHQKHGFTALPSVRVMFSVRIQKTKTLSSRDTANRKGMQSRAWDYPIIVPSTAFYSPPPMCLASHPYQRLLLLLCLGLSIR